MRFAHGLWPAKVLKGIVSRRWLYMSGLVLYSLLHRNLYFQTRDYLYSRPRAANGESAAFFSGGQWLADVCISKH